MHFVLFEFLLHLFTLDLIILLPVFRVQTTVDNVTPDLISSLRAFYFLLFTAFFRKDAFNLKNSQQRWIRVKTTQWRRGFFQPVEDIIVPQMNNLLSTINWYSFLIQKIMMISNPMKCDRIDKNHFLQPMTIKPFNNSFKNNTTFDWNLT